MITLRRSFCIKPMREFGFLLLQPVQSFLTPARGVAASKRRSPMRFRPCLEILEDRTLLSITASIECIANATSDATALGVNDVSMSNPGTATASYQTPAGSALGESTGSFQTGPSSFTGSASVTANAQTAQGGNSTFEGYGEVAFIINVAAPVTERITLTADLQFSTSQSTGHALGVVTIGYVEQGATVLLSANGTADNGPDDPLDAVNGTQFTYTTPALFPDYTFTALIATSSDDGTSSAGPQNCSMALSVTEEPLTTVTTTAVTPTPNPSAFGQPVTFTANVTPNTPGLPAPTGSVNFLDGSNVIGTGTLDASGQASFSTSSLAIGDHQITAQYLGDSYNNGSTSSPVTQTVSQISTTTTVGSSPDPSNYGQTVTFTATVTPSSPGPAAPTGTVTFMDGVNPLGSETLDNAGTATFQTSTLAVGDHPSITAVYSGDSNFMGSTSAAIDQLVNPVLPDIIVNSEQPTSKTSVQVNYSIANADVGTSFPIIIYRANTTQFNLDDPNFAADYQQIGSTIVPANEATDSTVNQVTVSIPGGFLPEPSHPYVLAVANPSGTIQESDSANDTNDTASFRVYTVAFVVPGFGYTANEIPPTWMQTMVADLEKSGSQGGAQYDLAIPFMWNSGTPLNPASWNPAYFVQAETALAQDVRDLASIVPPGNVLDVNLIGHSRGADVVANAAQLLAPASLPQSLQDGYFELTLLDPHPANNRYGLNASSILQYPGFSKTQYAEGLVVLLAYYRAQQDLNDPEIVIPSNVNYVSEYYQHTTVLQAPAGDEQILNLWGLTAQQITITDSQATFFTNHFIPAPVGHSEVPFWYIDHVLSALYNGPA